MSIFRLGRGFVELDLSSEGFEAGINRIADMSNRIQARLEELSQTARRTLVVGGVGVAGALKLAADQEEAERKLTAALKATGQARIADAETLKAQAAALQDTTRFSDQAIINLQAMAINMGATAEAADQATKDAIGLSNALGSDLNPTMLRMTLLAREGSTEMLNRYVPAIREAQTEQEKLAAFQQLVARGLEQEIALVDTATGQWIQVKNLLGEAGEEIGSSILPELKDLLSTLKEQVPEWIEYIKQNREAIAVNIEFAAKTLALLAVLPRVIAALKTIGLLLKAATTSALALVSAIGGLVVIGLAEALRQTEIEIRRMENALRDSVDATNDFAEATKRLREEASAGGQLTAARDALSALNRDVVNQEERIAEVRRRLASRTELSLGGLRSGVLDVLGVETYEQLRTEEAQIAALLEKQIELREKLRKEIELLEGPAFQEEFAKTIAEGERLVEQNAAAIREQQARQKEIDDAAAAVEAEKQRLAAERLERDRRQFEKTLRQFGASDKDRQLFNLEDDRDRLLAQARELGLGDDVVDDIQQRFAAQLEELGKGVEAIAKAGSILTPESLFRRVQTAALSVTDPATSTAKNTSKISKGVDDIKEKLAELIDSRSGINSGFQARFD
ncbi:MAG: hypothetical protein AAF432_00450 [Planctomycetota bacterium]